VVLLVLGVPVLVLVLALALERLEARLLPAREVELPDRDEVPARGSVADGRVGRPDLHPARVTSVPSCAP